MLNALKAISRDIQRQQNKPQSEAEEKQQENVWKSTQLYELYFAISNGDFIELA